jgi:hypothetical protein
MARLSNQSRFGGRPIASSAIQCFFKHQNAIESSVAMEELDGGLALTHLSL